MRKVILKLAVSLDGFIEGPNGEYDWCPPPSSVAMNSFLDGIDAVFFGRKSFDLVGAYRFESKKHYVFSTSLKKAKEAEVISKDAKVRIMELKNQPGKDIWLFGGANLVTYFMNEGLIDELILGLVPIVLGKGKPVFSEINQRKYFELIEAIPMDGYVSLCYRTNKK